MSRYFEWGAVFVFLTVGFAAMFYAAVTNRTWEKVLLITRRNMDRREKEALLEKRKLLQEQQKKKSLWTALDRQMDYSGLRRRLPGLGATGLFALNLVLAAVLFGILTALAGFLPGLAGVAGMVLLEGFGFLLARQKNLRSVNEDLMKFLDFLGNYNITGGELGSILGQISRYLNQPLRGALEECEAESRLTGDVGMAVLSMGEKIEHPQFKQLARNLELTSRYSTDFAPLVMDSRRSMREYLRQNQDRKGMLREAAINMLLLLIMSAVVLVVVAGLVGSDVPSLLATLPGRIALGVVCGILLLFGRQAMLMNR